MSEPVPIRPVSNFAYVMKEFLNAVERQLAPQEIQFVYDEEQSYESALASYRANQNITNETDNFLPVFAFRRDVLRYRESGVGRRSVVCQALDQKLDEDRAFKYRFVSGTLGIDFLYINDVAEEIEQFELIYMSESLLNRKKLLEVTIPEVDTFEYQVEFDPLTSKTLNFDNNYWKGVTGQVRISGMFLLFEGTSPIIKEIHSFVKNFNKSVYGQTTITPTP